MKILLGAFVPVAAYMGLIFALSAQSRPPVPRDIPDVFYHVPEYLVLSLLVIRGVRRIAPAIGAPAVACIAVFGATLYGASDEWHQSFVPGRVPSVHDLCSDAAGAILAVVVYYVAARIWSQPSTA